jgi:putative aldouronate transport system permease protein
MKKLQSISNMPRVSLGKRISKEFIANRYNYLLLLPALLYYIIFHYWPMYGAQIAFRDYFVTKGILDSQWVGMKHFISFFNSFYFERLIRNTFMLSGLSILFGFPAPIILALLLNEVRISKFKRTVQTITYLPHFVSLVVIAGIVLDFTRSSGLINDLLESAGMSRIPFMQNPRWFRPVYILSDIWQHIGWGSIIYLSAIASIPQDLYEAAKIDGTNRWQEMFHITIPGILSTIVVLLILRVGRIMSIGYEKVLLLYNESTYETADIISTYVFRRGIQNAEYSFSAAVGLFNSVINLTLLLAVNYLSKKYSEESLF